MGSDCPKGGHRASLNHSPFFPAMSAGEDDSADTFGQIGTTTLSKYAKKLEKDEITETWLKDKFGERNKDMVAIFDFLLKLNWGPLDR